MGDNYYKESINELAKESAIYKLLFKLLVFIGIRDDHLLSTFKNLKNMSIQLSESKNSFSAIENSYAKLYEARKNNSVTNSHISSFLHDVLAFCNWLVANATTDATVFASFHKRISKSLIQVIVEICDPAKCSPPTFVKEFAGHKNKANEERTMKTTKKLIIEANATLDLLNMQINEKKIIMSQIQNGAQTGSNNLQVASLIELCEQKDKQLNKQAFEILRVNAQFDPGVELKSLDNSFAIDPTIVKNTMDELFGDIAVLLGKLNIGEKNEELVVDEINDLFFQKAWSVFSRNHKIEKHQFSQSVIEQSQKGKQNLALFSSLLVDKLYLRLKKKLVDLDPKNNDILKPCCITAAKMSAQLSVCFPVAVFIVPGKSDDFDNSKHEDRTSNVIFSIVRCINPGLSVKLTGKTYLKANVSTLFNH